MLQHIFSTWMFISQHSSIADYQIPKLCKKILEHMQSVLHSISDYLQKYEYQLPTECADSGYLITCRAS